MLKVIVCLAVIIVASFLFGRHKGRIEGNSAAFEQAEVKVDTLVMRDTIVQYEPIYKEIYKVEKVLVPVVDTLRQTDTLYVYLDREQVVWRDSFSCVYASGILPSVDSVQHYITEKVIMQEVIIPKIKKTRWGIGVHAGYGAGLSNGKVIASPYIGVGVSYNIISW